MTPAGLLQPREVFLAIPSRGEVQAQTWQAIDAIRERHPGLMRPHIEEGSLCVADVRHRILREFRRTDRAALLMIDDDVIPPPTLLSLLADLARHPSVVGIPYPILRPQAPIPIPSAWRGSVEKGFMPLEPVRQGAALQECDLLATGCMLIHRQVVMHPDLRTPFFPGYDPDGVMIQSDDATFCFAARAAGFSIWARMDLCADHRSRVSLLRMHNGYLSVGRALR